MRPLLMLILSISTLLFSCSKDERTVSEKNPCECDHYLALNYEEVDCNKSCEFEGSVAFYMTGVPNGWSQNVSLLVNGDTSSLSTYSYMGYCNNLNDSNIVVYDFRSNQAIGFRANVAFPFSYYLGGNFQYMLIDNNDTNNYISGSFKVPVSGCLGVAVN